MREDRRELRRQDLVGLDYWILAWTDFLVGIIAE
jgi:hypothetical protein